MSRYPLFHYPFLPPSKVSTVSRSDRITLTLYLGAEQVVMSLSGFDQSESCSLKRLLRALGITLATTFSRRSSHLLCPSGAGLKFEKASEWGVPVINTKWLQAMASSGKIPAVHGYLVPGSIVPPHPDGDAMEIDRRDLKGKGKAVDKITTHAASADKGVHMDVDETGRMNDITNGAFSSSHLMSLRTLLMSLRRHSW